MKVDVVIVGGGPCGLSAAIALEEQGLKSIVLEKGNVVDTIYRYPTHQRFFSTSDKLEIGEVPFIIEGRKPKRNQALAYYREVVKRKELMVKRFEKVKLVTKLNDQTFIIESVDRNGDGKQYSANQVIIATGYYDSPNLMGIPGENLDKVFHYFKEGHPYFGCDVAVIGGKNSAIDAALELEKAGANVTVLYRGPEYSPSIKPWVLPEFEALVKSEKVKMLFNAHLREIKTGLIKYEINGVHREMKNDFVFAMTGYHPDHSFLRKMGVEVDGETGRPQFNPETMETNVRGIFIAGVIAAGNNANEIFIENGRHHGPLIAMAITKRMNI
jgi:thioredoxin reductase (NADPH)